MFSISCIPHKVCPKLYSGIDRIPDVGCGPHIFKTFPWCLWALWGWVVHVSGSTLRPCQPPTDQDGNRPTTARGQILWPTWPIWPTWPKWPTWTTPNTAIDRATDTFKLDTYLIPQTIYKHLCQSLFLLSQFSSVNIRLTMCWEIKYLGSKG